MSRSYTQRRLGSRIALGLRRQHSDVADEVLSAEARHRMLLRALLMREAGSTRSATPQSYEDLLQEVHDKLELLIAYFRARIAARDALQSGQLDQIEAQARDAAKCPTVADMAPLPSLTSAFATRRELFGAFGGEEVDG